MKAHLKFLVANLILNVANLILNNWLCWLDLIIRTER